MSEQLEMRIIELERQFVRLQEQLIKTNNALIAAQERELKRAALEGK